MLTRLQPPFQLCFVLFVKISFSLSGLLSVKRLQSFLISDLWDIVAHYVQLWGVKCITMDVITEHSEKKN